MGENKTEPVAEGEGFTDAELDHMMGKDEASWPQAAKDRIETAEANLAESENIAAERKATIASLREASTFAREALRQLMASRCWQEHSHSDEREIFEEADAKLATALAAAPGDAT